MKKTFDIKDLNYTNCRSRAERWSFPKGGGHELARLYYPHTFGTPYPRNVKRKIFPIFVTLKKCATSLAQRDLFWHYFFI